MTDKYKNTGQAVYYGILPESNSHEGYYPAKHSYWDDFWMLSGFKDGASTSPTSSASPKTRVDARGGDRICASASMTRSMRVIEAGKLKIIPGCVEFGDTDPTSTSVAIMACDETRPASGAVRNEHVRSATATISRRG